MKGLLELLAKAKLVELTEEEQSRADPAAAAPLPQEIPVAESLTELVPELPPAPLGEADAPLEEGFALERIYSLAGLSPSPFPAEKLLRLLDGLRAMDAATRKAAVLAMDAADDGWAITDPVTDARQKIAALNAYRQRLNSQVAAVEQQAGARMAENQANLERASAEIRTQIAELEQLLERSIAKSAQEAAAIEAEVRVGREVAAREMRRMDREIERLGEIPASFSEVKQEV